MALSWKNQVATCTKIQCKEGQANGDHLDHLTTYLDIREYHTSYFSKNLRFSDPPSRGKSEFLKISGDMIFKA